MVFGRMEVTGDTTLKPYTPPPPAAFDLYVPSVYAFHPPMPDNHAIKEGLSRALIHFPHLAGRLSSDELRRPCILLNDAGVRVIETKLPEALKEHLPLETSSGDLGRFLPPADGGEELLLVQLNRFACGGLAIGLSAHHRVADGQSMSFFFISWARLVRGLDLDALPYHDRAAISVPRSPPFCDFNHRAIEFREAHAPGAEQQASGGGHGDPSSISSFVVHFTAEFVSKLKSRFTSDDPSRRYSTFQCLLAHLWKKVTVARGLREEEVTKVRVAVNGRARMKPRVPMEYFGNLVLWAYPRLTVAELLGESYVYVADAIHGAVSAVDDAYFKSFIDFGAEVEKGEERGEKAPVPTASEVGSSLCPDLEVDSWLNFQFHELDFGGGPPSTFLPPELPIEGLLVFVPSCVEKGGVDVYMALLHQHVEFPPPIEHPPPKNPFPVSSPRSRHRRLSSADLRRWRIQIGHFVPPAQVGLPFSPCGYRRRHSGAAKGPATMAGPANQILWRLNPLATIRRSISGAHGRRLVATAAGAKAEPETPVPVKTEAEQDSSDQNEKDEKIYLRRPSSDESSSVTRDQTSVTMPMSFMTGSIIGKRFYKEVTTRMADDGNGWTVILDYRTLKTPSKRPLKMPSLALAKAIAAEWDYQDRPGRQLPLVFSLGKPFCGPRYWKAGSHLELRWFFWLFQSKTLDNERQIEKFDPLLDWVETEFGFKPVVYSSFFGGKQEDGLVKAVESALKKTNDCELAAIDAMAAAAHSLIIPLGLVRGQLEIEEAIKLIRLEEDLQVFSGLIVLTGGVWLKAAMISILLIYEFKFLLLLYF
ncbi:hypothetical protein Taro_013799 [Colocasia esculenta]|uniref:Uncharacterized protein n=1 Tax=Colocasia esculenta TaxID=4460 RepID=A0A843UN68_COLES|nr:hypothetical protein [Colocasia esculenta]